MDSMHKQEHKAKYIQHCEEYGIFLQDRVCDHLYWITHHQAHQSCDTVGQRREEADFGKQADPQQRVSEKHRQKLNKEARDFCNRQLDKLIHQD